MRKRTRRLSRRTKIKKPSKSIYEKRIGRRY